MNDLWDILIYVIMFGAQHILSSMRNKWMGLIVPLGYTAFVSYQIYIGSEKIIPALLISLLMYAFLGGIFYKARKELVQKQKSELNKMRTKDSL
ncbi:hypothetical protein [Macrococcus brunensis]|uniref:hypothetical protein n=1 Tax=Macrococcus brunensis TaxID=198483 RepID=UPI001EEFB32D|nr:hypothetical protein [Macrococcus brunensis]ULG72208.1 hypothetical protein MGG12_01385 [Macrococcus brunensis]